MGILTINNCMKWLDDNIDKERYGDGLAIELIAQLYHLNNGSTFSVFGIGNPNYFIDNNYAQWSRGNLSSIKQGDVVVTKSANSLGHIGIVRNVGTTTVDLVSQMNSDMRLDTYNISDCTEVVEPDYASSAPKISSASDAPQGQISPRLAINWTKSTLQDLFIDPYVGTDAKSFKLTTFAAGLIEGDTNLTDIKNLFIQANPQLVSCSDEFVDSIILNLLLSARYDKYIK